MPSLLWLVLLPLWGCSAGSTTSQYVVEQPVYQYERVSAQEEMLGLVREAPRDFFVPAAGDGPVWGRVAIFFREYLGVERPSRVENSLSSSAILSGKASGGSYAYTVERTPHGTGFQYKIICSGPNPSHGELAAKNLARFLRDGNLERSLVVR